MRLTAAVAADQGETMGAFNVLLTLLLLTLAGCLGAALLSLAASWLTGWALSPADVAALAWAFGWPLLVVLDPLSFEPS